MVLPIVFIRVKVRSLKPGLDGAKRVSWDFRLVESHRVEGKRLPQQRTIAALGAFRPDAGDVSPTRRAEFLSAVKRKIEAAEIDFSPQLRAQVEAWLDRERAFPRASVPVRPMGYLKRHFTGSPL